LKPWISQDLIQRIRLRDKLSKLLKKQPFNENLRLQFIEIRQVLSRSLKNEKRNYYREKINNSPHNPKVFWGVVNELAGKVNLLSQRFPRSKVFPLKSLLLIMK